MNKKRFIIHCTTDWCGMDNDYPALADTEGYLYEFADDLAIDNILKYIDKFEIAEEEDIYEDDYDNYDDYLEAVDNVDISKYVRSTIEPFTGTDEEWNELVKENGCFE